VPVVPAGHERDPHYPKPIAQTDSKERALLSVLWVARVNRDFRQVD